MPLFSMTKQSLNAKLAALAKEATKAGFKLEYYSRNLGEIHIHPGWYDGTAHGSAYLEFTPLTKDDSQYGT